MKRLYAYLYFSFLSVYIFSQDVHWTQWFIVPQSINLAYGGIKSHTLEAGAIYRNQWQNVPVGYNSIMLFGNADLQKEKLKNITLGATVLHDFAGASRFTTDQINVSIGFKKTFLDNNLLISIALQPAWKTMGFSTNQLTFSKNYDGERYNSALSNGETFLNQRSSTFTINSGIMANYHSNDFNFHLGYSRFYDAGKNKNALSNIKIKAEQRQNIMGGVNYAYSKKTILHYDFALFFINQQREWINAIGIKHQPNLKKQEFFSSAVIYRNKDAVSLHFGYEINAWQTFFAYDFNVSKFKAATRYNGAFEIGAKYTFNYPEIIKRKFRQCVIYI